MIAADFEQAIGQAFTVEAGGEQIAARIERGQPHRRQPAPGRRLFADVPGPARHRRCRRRPIDFTGKSGVHEIFIVPVAADAAGRLYEAVFN